MSYQLTVARGALGRAMEWQLPSSAPPGGPACASNSRFLRACDRMPSRVDLRDFRDTLTAIMRRVRQGETFEIADHGVSVAILAPLPGDPSEQS
jgi:hypothetical protein